MIEEVVRFKDLKIGESFLCYKYDPIYDNGVDLPGGATEYVKASENMVVITAGPVWRFLHRISGASWIFEFPLDIEVKRLDVPIYPMSNVGKWFKPGEKYHKYQGRAVR